MKRMVVECHGCCWVVAEALQLFQAEFQQANVRTLRVGGETILPNFLVFQRCYLIIAELPCQKTVLHQSWGQSFCRHETTIKPNRSFGSWMWLLESIHLIQDSPEAENPGIRSYEAALQACAQGWCRAKRQTHSFKKTMPNLLSKFDHSGPRLFPESTSTVQSKG